MNIWTDIRLPLFRYKIAKAQTNTCIRIFGLIFILSNTKIGNQLFVCCFQWSLLNKFNLIIY